MWVCTFILVQLLICSDKLLLSLFITQFHSMFPSLKK